MWFNTKLCQPEAKTNIIIKTAKNFSRIIKVWIMQHTEIIYSANNGDDYFEICLIFVHLNCVSVGEELELSFRKVWAYFSLLLKPWNYVVWCIIHSLCTIEISQSVKLRHFNYNNNNNSVKIICCWSLDFLFSFYLFYTKQSQHSNFNIVLAFLMITTETS